MCKVVQLQTTREETINAYKDSVYPAIVSGRVASKKVKAGEVDSLASSASPYFQLQAKDGLGSFGRQVARLIPHDTWRATFYEDVVVGVVGN